jgi:murein tripeptide amidase MpaA
MTHTDLLTLAETSNFAQTGRTDEVEHLAEALTRTWPDAVRSFEYGRSASGRVLRALVVSRSGALTAEGLHRAKRPILMLQAGIHPGESDGKDAGFIALRELLEGSAGAGLLERIAILFVPAFNTDGHERFGRWNRPNQVGPEEMGWRATAQNLNLNRDYTKAQSPEMQAMLRLLNEWDPLICADLHVTDGADFEPDISLQVEPVYQGDAELFATGTQLRDELITKLAAQDSLPLPFYPDLVEVDNPASGFHLTVYSPRFSTGYFPSRNRFTVLVETHSWKSYATRVRVTRNTIIGLAELASAHGARWLAEVQRADARAQQLGGSGVVLDYHAGWRESAQHPAGDESQASAASPASDPPQNDPPSSDPQVTMIDFRGYAYRRTPSKISGELVTVYDPSTPEIWHVPFRRNTTPRLIVPAPRVGYLVPAGYAREIGDKLALHGISSEVWPAAPTQCEVHVFRAERVEFSAVPFEGCTRATLDGSWSPERMEIGAGALLVRVAQSKARLLLALLEPQAPDSLAAWGLFNSWFEQKEYLEPYVAEMMAQELLNAQPQLAREFEHRLASDPAFAANAEARREFFQRRHPSWDSCFGLYPIFRLEQEA